MVEMRSAYKILVGKPEGKRPLLNFRCRWENNITMDLMETGREVRDWMHLALDRDHWQAPDNMKMSLRFP
jgi:hypothetical protein